MSDLEDDRNESESIRALTECSWEKISRTRYNDGMRDGDDDTEKIMQQGFSEGFQAAFKLISELSILRGTICTQMAMRPCDPKFHETLRDINWCEANVIEKLKGSHNLDLETLLMDISLKIKNTKMLMGIGPTP